MQISLFCVPQAHTHTRVIIHKYDRDDEKVVIFQSLHGLSQVRLLLRGEGGGNEYTLYDEDLIIVSDLNSIICKGQAQKQRKREKKGEQEPFPYRDV